VSGDDFHEAINMLERLGYEIDDESYYDYDD